MTWVEAERHSFAVDFRAADPDAPTLCAGWSVRHLCAHLVRREHPMLRNIWDQTTSKTPGEWRFMRRLVDDAGTPDGVELVPDGGPVTPVRRGPSAVTLGGSRLDLLLHAFGRRGAADVRVDGTSEGVGAFTRWAAQA
jgi:hypothetical protein